MPMRLEDMELLELSLVDNPANEDARVSIFKRDPSKDDDEDKLKEKGNMPDDVKKEVETLQAQVADLNKKLDAAQKVADTFEKVSKLSAEERQHYDSLKKADQTKFLEKSDEERDQIVKRAASDEEVLVVDGTEIRKSAVGASQFAVIKSQQKALTEKDERIAKVEAEAEKVRLEKRVSEEFRHVAGATEEKVALLKAASKMDEAASKALEAILKSAEALAKAGFEKVGARGEKLDPRGEDFEKKVSEIEARDKCPKHVAMSKARVEFPELYKAYQGH